MTTAADAPRGAGDDGYAGSVVAAAVLATLFFPLISLIAALVLLGSERGARRRRQLRTWAWASGGWIVLQVVVFLVLFAAVWSGSDATRADTGGPCVGGPVLDEPAEAAEDGSTVFPCEISGTVTMTLP